MILYNNSEKDIIDYRIEEAEFNSQGDIVMDATTNRPKWTGNTLEWTIKAKEKVEMPDYVAEYLMGIYPFLENAKLETKKEPKKKVKLAKVKVSGDFKCKFCSKSFTTQKGVGIHTGAVHYDKI